MSKAHGLNLPLLRQISRRLAIELFGNCPHELVVYYVRRKTITLMNEEFLGHQGPTDVITFDYSVPGILHSEIVICTDEAVRQAKEFGTTPQMELVRYLAHGLLHLRGYDDREPAQRQKMKRAEDKWVRWLAAHFPCEKVWSIKRAG